MTRDEAREFAKIVQAYVDGKTIQFRFDSGEWGDLQDPDFYSRTIHFYRIKPEPREWWGVLDREGDWSRLWNTREGAEACQRKLARDGTWPPYTIVHMREVTE